MAEPVLDPLKDFQSTSIEKVPYVQYLAIILEAISPPDRVPYGEHKGVTPVVPGAKNLKDLIGGPVGVLKGIAVDNIVPIIGAQPLGNKDQPASVLEDTIEASLAVAELGRTQRRILTDFENWPTEVRRDFIRRLENDFRLRAGVASTVEGRLLLDKLEIRLSQNERNIAEALQMKRENAAKKKGGSNPVVAAVKGVGDAVVDAVTQLDRLFAANPPDP